MIEITTGIQSSIIYKKFILKTHISHEKKENI